MVLRNKKMLRFFENQSIFEEEKYLILRLILIIDSRKPLILLYFSISSVRTLDHVRASFISLALIFYENQSSLIPLLFLFRKKSRSAHLFVCKRTHDGSLSLPTFCDIAHFVRLKNLGFTVFFDKFCKNTRTTSEQSSLCSVFLCRKTSARFLAPPFPKKSTALGLFGSPEKPYFRRSRSSQLKAHGFELY